MSRTSADRFDKDGRLLDGFDYDNQAWVADGHYLNCGHILKDCGCYGREHIGEPTVPPAKVGTKLYTMRVERVETSEGGIDVRASSEKEAVEKARDKARQGLVIFPAIKPITEYNPRVDEFVDPE